MIQLTNILCTDLVAISRGRAFPTSDLENYLNSGVGWVPADQALTPFDTIADNPWGSHGDLRLMPDPATEVKVDVLPNVAPLHFFLADITNLDGTPWDCCSRGFLKKALQDLETLAGIKVISAFEHEFVLGNNTLPKRPAFSLEAFRNSEPFGRLLVEALQQAGQEPEMFLPEYSANQFEITCKPSDALVAADRAVIIKILARDIAHRLGLECSFAPKVNAESGGSGVHIHYSFVDQQDQPLTYDPDGPAGMSKLAAQFAAGIVAHMPALCSFTAPSVLSYLRLQPHHWSSAYTCLGAMNREATLRICPVSELLGTDIARQFNLEYRAADALANPYLALGVLIRAGIEGIKNEMPCPSLLNRDPGEYSTRELEDMQVKRLPQSLSEALVALQNDRIVCDWFSSDLLQCYLSVKNNEINAVADLEIDAMIKRYMDIY